MPFLDSLKAFFNADISGLKSISLKVLSGNMLRITVDKSDHSKHYHFNLNQPDQLEAVQKMIQGGFEEEGVVVEDSAESVVEGITASSSDSANVALLAFFEGKISAQDYEILRAATYVRSRFVLHENVRPDIERIIASYGRRGRNMTNLCTSGYFESLLIPLYEQMASEEPDTTILQANFKERFESLVDNAPFAVFVSDKMSLEELVSSITTKIQMNLDYGIHEMSIHGAGRANVLRIEEALSSEAVRSLLTAASSIENRTTVINVKLTF